MPSSSTTVQRLHSDVGMDYLGNFAVTWEVHNSDGESDVFLRLFGANGTPAIPEIPVADSFVQSEEAPRIAVSPDGAHTVVVWQEINPNDSSSHYQVKYDYITAAGQFTGTVSTDTTRDNYQPDVAMAADGSFVVTFTKKFSSTDYDIYYRRFNASGNPLTGSPIGVATSGDLEENPAVAVTPNGSRFVIAWENHHSGQVLYNLYDGSGNVLLLNHADTGPTIGSQDLLPAVGMAADGRFVLALQESSGSGQGVAVQLTYHSAGGAQGPQSIFTPQAPDNAVGQPAIAVGDDGRTLLAYITGSTSTLQAQAQVQGFTATGALDGPAHFEAANTLTAPSVARHGNQVVVSYTSGDSLFTSSSDTILAITLAQVTNTGAGTTAAGVTVQRSGKSGVVTGFVVQFSGALQNPGQYSLSVVSKGGKHHKPRHLTLVPVYNAGTDTVTLAARLRGNDRTATLTITGATDQDGNPLGTLTFTLNVKPGRRKHH